MRVVFDGRIISDHFPGIGRYAYHLVGALAERDDVQVTLLHDPRAASTRYDLKALSRSHPRLTLCPIAVSPFTLAEQTRIAPLARSLRPDVWHSLHYMMPLLGLPRPIVLTLHDLIPLVLSEYWSASNRLIYRLAHDLALRTTTHIITPSAATRRDLTRFFRIEPERVSVIPEGVDARFKPASVDAVALIRQKYCLQSPYVLYVGINKPPKNLARLVEAYAHLVAESPGFDCDCVIAGAWDDRYPEAQQRAAELGLHQRVRFLGPLPETDLPALYSGADMFVTASLYEGFGLPVLEAMACGTPVVCSHTSSLPEVVGDAALLFDPLDARAIAGAIRRVLTDPDLRSRLKQRGLARAAQFGWDRTVENTVAIYRAAMAVPTGLRSKTARHE